MRRVLASVLLTLGLSAVSCGPVEATSDMTLSVTPSSISFTDRSQNVSTSTEVLIVSVLTAEGDPASDIKVYASIDSFWVNSGLLWFTDCEGQTTCSCTTGDSGRCGIRVTYRHGGGLEYKANVVVYSGVLTETVTVEVKSQ